MKPKVEIIKEGLLKVRGGAFSYHVQDVPPPPKENCKIECLVINHNTVGTYMGDVTT